MRGCRIAVASVLVWVSCALVASPTLASTSVERFKVEGYASALFGNCPDVPIPPAGTVCRETSIQIAREAVAVGGGGVSTAKLPWGAFYFESTLTFLGDNHPAESDVRFGFAEFDDPSAVTHDREHLRFASVNGEIPLSDGTSVTVDLDWHAISERFVYGNDGPALGDFGRVRHYVDKCSTQVNQGHQKFRVAAMTGTVNGSPVHSYTSFPAGYISFNHFVFINVTHGTVCE